MIAAFVYVCLIIYPTLVFSLERGAPCVTPNGENATCIALDSCKVIKDAITTGDQTARKFAKASECGVENVPLVCCGSSGVPLGNPNKTWSKLPDKTECGYQKEDERVYGGQITEIGEFPWLVLLGYHNSESEETEFKCGGTLINVRYVLTAAHCMRVRRRSGLTLEIVRLGEWRISTEEDCVEDVVNDECADPVIDMKIELQIPHPNYSRKTGNNDIGLIRLERNIKMSDYVNPICLPNPDALPPNVGILMFISGWGATENGSQSDYKLKLEVPIVESLNCAAKIQTVGQVTENQVCAGGEKGKDACQGDSGGPLMGMLGKKTQYKSQWYQEGIIAYGIGCGRKDFPGIYTRVAKYITWILDNILEF